MSIRGEGKLRWEMNKLVELEWRQNKRSFWIAFLLVGILQAIPAVVAKSYLESQHMINKPQKEEQGTYVDTLSTFEGWISGQPFTFFLLILGSFAINWGIGTIVKERDRQTTEFLFAMPRSRTSIYFAKWFANVIQVLIIAAASAGIVLLIGKGTNVMNDPWVVADVITSGLLITLGFMGIGFALTSWLNSERGALSLGIGIVFVMFLLSMLSELNENMNWLANLSLFNLFDVHTISQGNGIPVANIFGAIAIFTVGSLAGWIKLINRDL